MAPKFTPGPWAVEGDVGDLPADIGVGICNRGHAGVDWDVCSVHSSAANAHLISAAPDLYAVLSVIRAEADRSDWYDVLVDRALIEQARAALAKAEGK